MKIVCVADCEREEPIDEEQLAKDIRFWLESLGATEVKVKVETAPGAPHIRYWCWGCRQDHMPGLHNFAVCQEDAKRKDEEERLEDERIKARCAVLGQENAEVLQAAKGVVGKYGDSLVRQLARDIYELDSLPDYNCSSGMESRYTLIIKAAIPDYINK